MCVGRWLLILQKPATSNQLRHVVLITRFQTFEHHRNHWNLRRGVHGCVVASSIDQTHQREEGGRHFSFLSHHSVMWIDLVDHLRSEKGGSSYYYYQFRFAGNQCHCTDPGRQIQKRKIKRRVFDTRKTPSLTILSTTH